jgi:hypothetical protein
MKQFVLQLVLQSGVPHTIVGPFNSHDAARECASKNWTTHFQKGRFVICDLESPDYAPNL